MKINVVARFVIRAGEQDSRLFSVGEDEEGGIALFLRTDQFYIPPGQDIGPFLKIISQKYSIHASNRSPNNNTYINNTLLMSYEKKRESKYVTQAIKGKQNFIFLFCRRCSDLRGPIFKTKPSDTDQIHIGSYNPDFFTLIYSVIVCAVEEKSPLENIEGFWYGEYNVLRKDFGKISLIVIWTLLSLPSHLRSLTYHNETKTPESTINPEFDGGITNQKCIRTLFDQCHILEEDLRTFILSVGPPLIPGQTVYAPGVRYFKSGDQDTNDAKNHREMLQMVSGTLEQLEQFNRDNGIV